MPYTSFIPLIDSIACLGLALFILSRSFKNLTNISFALGMSSLALMEFANSMALFSSSPADILFWVQLARVAECLLPGSWVLFSYTFARKDYREIISKRKVIIAFFYVVPLLLLSLCYTNGFLTLPELEGPISMFRIENIGYYFYLFLCFSMIFILARLEGILRSSKGAERWQVKYAILGLGSIFASFIFVISQRLLYFTIQLDLIPVHSLIILISLALILFATVRHRLMEVDIFVSRYAIYSSLTVLFVGAYFLALGLLGELTKHFGLDIGHFWKIPIIFTSTLVLLALLLSETLKRKVKYFIRRHFYKYKYDYRYQWHTFSEKLSDKFTTTEICDATLEILVKSMYVGEMSIWLYDEEKKRLEIASSKALPAIDFGIGEESALISYLKTRNSFILINDLKNDKEGDSIYQQNREFFEKTNASLCVPMMVGARFMGLITIGPEFTGGEFIEDDFDLVRSIAAQASNALLNARLSGQLVAAKEQETFQRLSSFIVHDLKNFVSMLSLIVQNASDNFDNPEFQRDVLNTISNTVAKMKRLMAQLSAVPKTLDFSMQKLDLNKLVAETIDSPGRIDHVKGNGLRELNFVSQFGPIPHIKGDMNQLKKVFTNLIVNALEAVSNNGEIKVNTYSDDGWAVFSISDNGPGMDKEFKERYLFKPFHSTKEKGLGIGLFQCKTIIEAHKGRIEVESEKGKGCTFRVKLPLDR